MITDRDIKILRVLVRYYVLSRQQIQRLVFPADSNGRIARRRIGYLASAKLINRQTPQFCHPSLTPAPVYYPAIQGCQLLAEHFGDDRYLATPTQAPTPHHTFHWLAVSDTHIVFDEAVKKQTAVQLDGWLNEWDIVNKEETAPEKRYRLYTLIRDNPRLVCAPDAALLLSIGGISKMFYLEQDRATSGVQQIAGGKTGGYSALAEQKLYRRHFTSTLDEFTVLMVAPSARRRDALRKAIDGKPGSSLWRFADAHDLCPETLFTAPVFFPCTGDPQSLVKSSGGGESAETVIKTETKHTQNTNIEGAV